MHTESKIERVVTFAMMIFCRCGCGGTFAGAHMSAISRVVTRCCMANTAPLGGGSGRTNGTVQIYAALFGRGGGDVAAPHHRLPGELIVSGQRSAKSLPGGRSVEVDGKAKVVVSMIGCVG